VWTEGVDAEVVVDLRQNLRLLNYHSANLN
jgi:hypothetical protein